MSSSFDRMYDHIAPLPKFLEKSHPSSTLLEWRKGIFTACTKIGAEIYVGGMRSRGLHLSTAEWAAAHPPVPDANGHLQPVQRDPDPVMPVIPDVNATAAVSTHYTRMNEKYKIHVAGINKLHSMILDSFNGAMFKETEDTVNNTGHADRSVEFLISYIVTTYGGATADTLKTHKASLLLPIESEEEVASGFNRFIADFNALANINQAKCTSDQLEIVTTACSALPNVMHAIQLYNERVTNISLRNVADMKVFVVEQQPNFSTYSAGYVGSVKTSPAAPQQADVIAQAVAKGIAQGLSLMRAELLKSSGVVDGTRPGAPAPPGLQQPKKKPKADKTVAYYCFFHGAGHSGGHCNWMAPERSTEFTDAQRACTIPGQFIDGKRGHA